MNNLFDNDGFLSYGVSEVLPHETFESCVKSVVIVGVETEKQIPWPSNRENIKCC
jgi:hypothetical protein